MGATSGDIYLYGWLTEGLGDYGYFRRIHNNYTDVWSQIYYSIPNYFAFDVDSTETYTYSLIKSASDFHFYKLDASNGQIIQVVQDSSGIFHTFSDNLKISLSQQSEVLYLLATDSGSENVV